MPANVVYKEWMKVKLWPAGARLLCDLLIF